ncbi:MAG: winged helix-turn-helix transcriptional regulator [Candidatus Micrarchaeota archaeon]
MPKKIRKEEKTRGEAPVVDLKDRKILYALDLNGRATNREIARKVGLSQEVVAYRIKRLMDEGIIEFFQTVINVARLGYITFRVYLKLQDIDLKKERELTAFLIKHKKVWWIAPTDGYWQIDFAVWVRTVYEFDGFWAEMMRLYKPYVQDRQISIYTELRHYTRAFLVGAKEREASEPEIVGGGETIEYDEVDVKILRILGPVGRMPLLEIARKVRTSPKVVAYRMKKLMEKGVIQGFKPMINLRALGYQYFKIDVNLRDYNEVGKFLAFARSHPNIVYVDRTIGGSDFECDIQVRSAEEFEGIMRAMRERFGDVIRDYEYFRVLSELKIVYMPSA